MMMVMENEISAARNERLETIRRGPNAAEKKKNGGTRKKVFHVLEDFYNTVFDGTKQHRKDEIQRCCICGAITVWRGYPTGHAGSHATWNRSRDQ